MNLKASSAKLIPPVTKGFHCQIFEHDAPSDKLKLGYLTIIAIIKDDDSSQIAHQIFNKFVEDYYSSQLPAFDSLKKVTNSILAQLESSVSLCILINLENLVYIASTGDIYAYLLRESVLGKLIAPVSKVMFISGQVSEKDTLLICNSSFLRNQPIGVLKAALNHSDMQTVQDMLASSATADQGVGLIQKYGNKNFSGSQIKGVALNIKKPLKIVDFTKSLLIWMIDKLLSLLPRNDLYLTSYNQSTKRRPTSARAALIGIILILVLGISVYFGINKSKQDRILADFEDKRTQILHNVEEAKNLSALNPNRARSLILDAQKQVEKLRDDGFDTTLVDPLSQEVEADIAAIAGIYSADAQVYLDLSLVSSGLEADSLEFSDGHMVALDKSSKKIVSIVLDSKRTEILAKLDDEKVKDIAVYVNRSFALTDNGVLELDDTARKVISKDWGSDSLLSAFAGNLYLLDNDNKGIYRFSGHVGSFGSKQNWLRADNFTGENVISWAIDGNIWTLDSSGQVYRFSSGVQDPFYPQPQVENADAMYTSENDQNLYFLDTQGSRILVYDKRGQFKAEYHSSELKNAKDFIVSEADKKIIFLSGSKLYELALDRI